MAITLEEFKKIEEIVLQATAPIQSDIVELNRQMSLITLDVGQFLRIVQRHEQEWLIIRTQHQKMREILVKNGIATEEELAIA